jgi:hypothetical protein
MIFSARKDLVYEVHQKAVVGHYYGFRRFGIGSDLGLGTKPET